jgi:hypothetical protein
MLACDDAIVASRDHRYGDLVDFLVTTTASVPSQINHILD